MKNLLLLLLILPLSILAQPNKDKGWTHMNDEKTRTIKVTKENTIVEIDNFRFEMLWDDKQNYSENLGRYYGGIGSVKVYKNGNHIQTLGKIEDGIAMGYISLTFYDYNMDGNIDFSFPIDCGNVCYSGYYLYDLDKEKYEHVEKWDYLRIWEINKDKKQFLTTPSGTAMRGEQEWYQIEGTKLNLLETIYYGK